MLKKMVKKYKKFAASPVTFLITVFDWIQRKMQLQYNYFYIYMFTIE